MHKIKKNIKYLLKDEEGATITVLMLVIIPMLIIALISLVENTNTMRGSDSTLQNAVNVISRHTAMMINPVSQSKGDPLIAHKRAYNLLLDELNYTLGQDVEDTTLQNIKFWFIVYNGRYTYKGLEFEGEDIIREVEVPYTEEGDADLAGEEIVSYAYYTNIEGYFEKHNDIMGEQSFFISDKGISKTKSKGSVKVTLTDPGVLLVINADVNPIMVAAKESENVTRWAYAKIVSKNN